MTELAKQLEGKKIVLKARAGAEDRLYGSVTNADIAEELNKSAGLAVDKRKIELDEPIREIGSYEIAIRLTKDIVPKIKLTVAEEEKKKEGKEKKEGKRKKAGKADKVEEEGKEKKEEGKEKKEGKKKASKAEKIEEEGKEKKEEPQETEEETN